LPKAQAAFQQSAAKETALRAQFDALAASVATQYGYGAAWAFHGKRLSDYGGYILKALSPSHSRGADDYRVGQRLL